MVLLLVLVVVVVVVLVERCWRASPDVEEEKQLRSVVRGSSSLVHVGGVSSSFPDDVSSPSIVNFSRLCTLILASLFPLSPSVPSSSIYLPIVPFRLSASASRFPSPFSCSSLSLAAVLGSERHRYLPPVSQRQLTAAGRSPVPSCTAADKDPTAPERRRKRPRAGQSAGSPVAADCIGRAPVLLSSIPPVR